MQKPQNPINIPEEPAIIVDYYNTPPISFPTQREADEDITNNLVSTESLSLR